MRIYDPKHGLLANFFFCSPKPMNEFMDYGVQTERSVSILYSPRFQPWDSEVHEIVLMDFPFCSVDYMF